MLLDGHSLAYRAFYALPAENFSTATGQVTNAVFGFTSMLINMLRDEKPTHIAVAFDVSRQSFRTERYAEYKAGRSQTPEIFSGQVSLVREVLAALRIPTVEKAGYEADDVIATLACQASDAGMQVLIVTGDRDAFQLADERTTVLYLKRGVSEMDRMTPDAISGRYGVGPDTYRDLAAMVGESSDNLPGVPGVGPKTAAKWIVQFGGLDGVVAHVDEIKGKAGDNLRAHLADVLRNHEINKLVTDLELPIGPDDMHWHGWDREAVHRVFDALEFRILRDRLYQYLEAVEPEAEAGFDVDCTVLGAGAVAPWLAAFAPAGTAVGVAVGGTFGRGTGQLAGVAVATEEGPAAWFDPARLDATDEPSVAAWLADPERPKVLHDAKPALLAFAEHGWTLRGVLHDTALTAYLARPDQRSYDLTDLALRYLQRELRVEAGPDDGQLTLDGLGDDGEAERNLMLRARATLDLADALEMELTRDGGTATRLLAEVELPLVEVLARMERTGIAADTQYLSELEAHFAAEVKAAAQAAYEVVGREFNLGSPKQLQEILFGELSRYGFIQLNAYRERFVAPLVYWTVADYRRQWRGVKDAKNDYIRMEQLGAWLVEYRDCAEAYALIRSAMVALVVQVFRKDVFLRIIKEVRPEFEVDGRNGRLALSWDSLNECLMDSLKRPPRLVEGRRGHGKTASGLMEVLWGEDGQYNRGRWGEKMAYRQVYKVGQTHYVLAHDGRSEGRRSWRRAVERECIRTCWLLPYPQLSNDGRFMQRTSHQPGDPPSQLMWVGIGHGDVYDGLMEVVEEEQKAVISYSKIRQVFSRAGVVSANEMDMVTERGDCLSGWPESNEEVLSCSLGEMEDRLILIKSRQDCRRRDGRGELQRR